MHHLRATPISCAKATTFSRCKHTLARTRSSSSEATESPAAFQKVITHPQTSTAFPSTKVPVYQNSYRNTQQSTESRSGISGADSYLVPNQRALGQPSWKRSCDKSSQWRPTVTGQSAGPQCPLRRQEAMILRRSEAR